MADEWRTVKQAAERLEVSERTISRMVQAGTLPAYTIGRSVRFKLADVEALRLERTTPRPVAPGA